MKLDLPARGFNSLQVHHKQECSMKFMARAYFMAQRGDDLEWDTWTIVCWYLWN